MHWLWTIPRPSPARSSSKQKQDLAKNVKSRKSPKHLKYAETLNSPRRSRKIEDLNPPRKDVSTPFYRGEERKLASLQVIASKKSYYHSTSSEEEIPHDMTIRRPKIEDKTIN